MKFGGARRQTLEKNLEQALAADNQEAVAKIREELDQLPAPRLAFRTSMTPSSQTPNGTPKKEGLSQQERLAQINAENRRKNAEAVRQAQIKERGKIRDKTQRNDSVEPGRSPRVGASLGKSPAVKPKEGLLPHMEKLRLLQQQNVNKTGVAVIHKPLMDDDIIGALDLDIDVEI